MGAAVAVAADAVAGAAAAADFVDMDSHHPAGVRTDRDTYLEGFAVVADAEAADFAEAGAVAAADSVEDIAAAAAGAAAVAVAADFAGMG